MPDGHAVYGFELLGLRLGPFGPTAPDHWPKWTIEQELGPADDSAGLSVWHNRARIGFPGTGELVLDRIAKTITLRTSDRWSDQALLHPCLSPAAVVVAHWMGRISLHASAVVIDGRAWGILGPQGAGKSTTAALLAVTDGCALLTDDLLVVGGMTGFAGPGAVDLRADAAAELGGDPLGRLGHRERWRKSFSIEALEAPLAGWLELAWDPDAPMLVALSVSDRLELLTRSAGLPLPGEHLLDLAARPAFRFSRAASPLTLSGLDDLRDQLRELGSGGT